MQQVITVKLKLLATPQQKEKLRNVCLAYRDALNYTSQVAFKNDLTSSAGKLHNLTYNEIRASFGLASQMACRVPKNVASTYAGLWTKTKQNAKHLRAGITKKRYKGLDKPPIFVARLAELVYQRDYGFKEGQIVSVMTLDGRIPIPYAGYSKHLKLIKEGNKVGGARIWYSKSSKIYYLLVSLEVEVKQPKAREIPNVVGVDVGQRYLAVTTSTNNQTDFYSGKKTIHTVNRYQKSRKSLQRKGTRSATRRLVALSGRERRFKADVNHQLSRQIVKPSTIIGMEHLTGIRDRTNRSSNKQHSRKQKRANRRQSTWAFRELQTFIDYKARLSSAVAIYVDANNTSKSCPSCGHTDDKNRPHKGLKFKCVSCARELHADLVGARNVCLRALLVRHDWMSTGGLSTSPDVSDAEAKAARLSRFAELRWSSDASLTSITR